MIEEFREYENSDRLAQIQNALAALFRRKLANLILAELSGKEHIVAHFGGARALQAVIDLGGNVGSDEGLELGVLFRVPGESLEQFCVVL